MEITSSFLMLVISEISLEKVNKQRYSVCAINAVSTVRATNIDVQMRSSNDQLSPKVVTGPLLCYSVTNEVTFLSNDVTDHYFLFVGNRPSNGSYFFGPLLRCFLVRYSVILLVV